MLNAGCAEIFGRRSNGAASEAMITDDVGLNAPGDNVGRRGVIEVNVLFTSIELDCESTLVTIGVTLRP